MTSAATVRAIPGIVSCTVSVPPRLPFHAPMNPLRWWYRLLSPVTDSRGAALSCPSSVRHPLSLSLTPPLYQFVIILLSNLARNRTRSTPTGKSSWPKCAESSERRWDHAMSGIQTAVGSSGLFRQRNNQLTHRRTAAVGLLTATSSPRWD
jgi:hypothetical protein